MPSVISYKCPNCGNPIDVNISICDCCDSPVYITSMSSLDNMSMPKIKKYANAYESMLDEGADSEMIAISLGLCFLKLGLHEKAFNAFDKAIDAYTENPEVYFYAAVCLLKGEKPFLTSKANVDKAIKMLEIANDCEARGIFYYFDAYLRFDYYKRKALNIQPPYTDSLQKARRLGCSPADISMLFNILKTDIPAELR